MNSMFDLNRAKEMVEGGISEATEMLRNPQKIDSLLVQAEEALKKVPFAGDMLAKVPLMISMIKSYINGSYAKVSVKVIAAMVSSLLYLIKRKDLIPDSLPIVGHADDIAVIGFALKLCENELNEYKDWRDGYQV